MITLRESAEIGLDYINDALVKHDQAYGDHPSMQKERQSIVDHLKAVQKVLSERQECETCAAKRQKLTEAGLLKSPMREFKEGRTEELRMALESFSHELNRVSKEVIQSLAVPPNTDTAVPSEPVAWVSLEGVKTPLYVKPPKREWVGLTGDEILECAGIEGADTWLFETVYAIESKLREKNNG
jgi:hypothetical protein